MSWNESLFLFGQTASAPSGQTFTFDLSIVKSYPAVEFFGTENGSTYAEVREVNGDLWVVQNAQFNGTSWVPQALGTPVYATVYRNPAAAQNGGWVQRLYCAAGTNPVVWTTIYSIDNLGNVHAGQIGQMQQVGTITNQLIDGSTNAVTYTNQGGFAFPNSTDAVFLSISGLSDSAALPGASIITQKATTGFQFVTPGGNNGDTATFDYLALGH